MNSEEIMDFISYVIAFWKRDLTAGSPGARAQALQDLARAKQTPEEVPLLKAAAAATGITASAIIAALEVQANQPTKPATRRTRPAGEPIV
jgi:hypothetical protein